jgi:hypothetical protein
MDRALFTVIDGYDVEKMMQGISWCWTEGSRCFSPPQLK